MTQADAVRVERHGDLETIVVRRFAAARDEVFAALTTPDLLRQWMSAAGRDLVEATIDLRSGGDFRYVFRSSSGRTFGMYGTFREVVPDRRIVHTEAYDGYDWDPLITTTELRDDGDGTVLTLTIRYPSPEIRDRDFESVASGSRDGFQRLAALLAR